MSKPMIVLLILLGLFIVAQFVRPPLNVATGSPTDAIVPKFPVPMTIQALLRRSCYDCHSNNTVYPWYSYVEPAGWLQASHIKDGKHALNFDEFMSYPAAKQYHRFGDIREQIEEGNMPLSSYTLIHRYAILSPEEKESLIQWTENMRDTMRNWYPIDSLQHAHRPR